MRSSNTFGVHYTLRNKEQNGKQPIYARIVVNKTRCELSLKHYLPKNDWNEIKGIAKAKNEELKQRQKQHASHIRKRTWNLFKK